jgi:PKD repeat protein
VINDNYGYLVDSVFYGVTPPWDTLANGFGSSLELCNPNSDNTDPLNWRHAIEFQTVNASGDTIWASPLAGCSYAPVAVFSANKTIIVEHEFVTFTDASTINTADWEWTFEGGTPATYSGKTPPPIQYNTMGLYDVSLRVSNNAGHNTMVKSNYINVGTTGISGMDATGFSVYPNPNSGTFKVILKNSNPVQFRIFNQLSNLVLERKSELQVNLFEKSELAPGIYMLQVTDLTTQQSHTQKLVIQ